MTNAADRIQRLAYELWEKEGHKHGREHEHWQQAERILAEREAGEPKHRAVAATPGHGTEAGGPDRAVAKMPKGAGAAPATVKAAPAKPPQEQAPAKKPAAAKPTAAKPATPAPKPRGKR